MKTTKKDESLRIRLITRDGCLIMDRPAAQWVLDDLDFLQHTMTVDARLKGVVIVSKISVTSLGATATVDYL